MRDTSDVAGGARRMIRALGERVAEEDPADLRLLLRLRVELDRAMAVAVDGLRAGGHTDGDIGEVLGMSRQAVQQRWPRTVRRIGAGARYVSSG